MSAGARPQHSQARPAAIAGDDGKRKSVLFFDGYVVLKPFTFPASLYGGNSTSFIVAQGALPSDNPSEGCHAMVRELARYVADFNPGRNWEDEDSDIDWKRSYYQSNLTDVIFINEVGTWDWRPETHYAAIPNLFFAGDFCRNKIDMATVEAAVTSGLNAAIALQEQAPLGEPIKILRPNTYSSSMLRSMKLMMTPSAYAAKWWQTVADVARDASSGKPPAQWSADLVSLMGLPYAYAADCLETTGSLWADLFLGNTALSTHPTNAFRTRRRSPRHNEQRGPRQ